MIVKIATTNDLQRVSHLLATDPQAALRVLDRRIEAMVQNGACFPFPSRIPEIHNPTVWVSEQWLPCSAVTIAPYLHPIKVMEAFK